MPSLNVFSLVDKTIFNFVKENKTFTAYDVTKDVRSHTFEIFKHSDVRDYIHDKLNSYVSSGFYTKEQHRSIPAFVYQPLLVYEPVGDTTNHTKGPTNSKDVNGVLNSIFDLMLDAVYGSIGVPAVINSNTTNFSGSNVNKDSKKQVDGRNRFCVPTSFVNSAGFKVGDKIFAYKYGNSVILSRHDARQGNVPFTSATVDRSGNLRFRTNNWPKLKFDVKDMGSYLEII